MKLMDIDAEHLGVPDQKYSAIIEMSSAEFKKVVGDLSSFSDTVTINATKGQVIFESGAGESGQNVVTFNSDEEVKDEMDDEGDKEDDQGVMISVTENVKLSFSVKYFIHFAKATTLAPRVRLSMTNRVPVVVEYQIEDDGFLKYYLAPKIDEENEMED